MISVSPIRVAERPSPEQVIEEELSHGCRRVVNKRLALTLALVLFDRHPSGQAILFAQRVIQELKARVDHLASNVRL